MKATRLGSHAVTHILASLWLLLFASSSFAEAYPDVVGEIAATKTRGNESIMEVARRTGMGYENVANANPQVDPWVPGEGTEIILPRKTILPAKASHGLTINLAEMRLYFLNPLTKEKPVRIYPLGIGREGRNTPQGLFRVTSKKVNPIWRVPKGLREADPTLPELVGPGPDNPLGSYWLGLSAPGYGIHGTNRPLGVGRRISYGCLRMYPEQVAALYPQVPIGTPVRIVYQPVKAGWQDDVLLLEVHPDYRKTEKSLFQYAMDAIGRVAGSVKVDYARVKLVVATPDGLPKVIGQR